MNFDIKPGQVWLYKNRAGEDNSRLTILKIEHLDNSTIVHVSIDGLAPKTKTGDLAPVTSIGHMPFDLEALNKSLVKIEGITKVTIDEGYTYWKEAFDNGEAGVWAIDVADAISLTEQAFG